MKKLFTLVFVLSFVVTPVVSHAGLFDFLRSNQSAQIRTTATTNTTASTTTTYRRGDRAAAVLEAQQALSAAGLYAGDLSGLIGPRTEAAIKAWQTNNRLPATGILDAVTLRSIVGRGADNERGGGSTTRTNCAPGDTPWIEVKKPNGGETHVPGENVKVQWDSCNVPPGVDIGISLLNQISDVPVQNIEHNLIVQTGNDGIEQVTLNQQAGMPALEFGTKFKILIYYVVTNDYDYNTYGVNPPWMQLDDKSDNLFSIVESLGGGGTEPSGSMTAMCNAKVLYPHPGQTFTLEENATPAGGDIQVYGFVLVDNDTSDCVWDTYGSLVPTNDPNSGVGGLLAVVENQPGSAPLNIIGNYNFANPTIGNRLYSQSVIFDPQTDPAGQYTLQFTDMDNQNPIIIPINIQY